LNGQAKTILLEVVAEKTGYPSDMLELDMELDADLGIDSIKRVEIFSRLQERLPQAPIIKPEHLGSLRTLRHVVAFLGETESHPASNCNGIHIAPSTAGAPLSDPNVLLEVVAEKTGYPAEMLELDMELDADLGIDSIKRVEIFSRLQERLPEAPAIKPEHLGSLRTLRHVLEFISSGNSQSQQTRAAESIDRPGSLGATGAISRFLPDRFLQVVTTCRPGLARSRESRWFGPRDGFPAGRCVWSLGARHGN
jgi:acyl carrier protein